VDYDIFDETNEVFWEQFMTGIRSISHKSKNILLSEIEGNSPFENEDFGENDDPFFSTSLSFKIN
jgi:hypothetical protein